MAKKKYRDKVSRRKVNRITSKKGRKSTKRKLNKKRDTTDISIINLFRHFKKIKGGQRGGRKQLLMLAKDVLSKIKGNLVLEQFSINLLICHIIILDQLAYMLNESMDIFKVGLERTNIKINSTVMRPGGAVDDNSIAHNEMVSFLQEVGDINSEIKLIMNLFINIILGKLEAPTLERAYTNDEQKKWKKKIIDSINAIPQPGIDLALGWMWGHISAGDIIREYIDQYGVNTQSAFHMMDSAKSLNNNIDPFLDPNVANDPMSNFPIEAYNLVLDQFDAAAVLGDGWPQAHFDEIQNKMEEAQAAGTLRSVLLGCVVNMHNNLTGGGPGEIDPQDYELWRAVQGNEQTFRFHKMTMLVVLCYRVIEICGQLRFDLEQQSDEVEWLAQQPGDLDATNTDNVAIMRINIQGSINRLDSMVSPMRSLDNILSDITIDQAIYGDHGDNPGDD